MMCDYVIMVSFTSCSILDAQTVEMFFQTQELRQLKVTFPNLILIDNGPLADS